MQSFTTQTIFPNQMDYNNTSYLKQARPCLFGYSKWKINKSLTLKALHSEHVIMICLLDLHSVLEVQSRWICQCFLSMLNPEARIKTRDVCCLWIASLGQRLLLFCEVRLHSCIQSMNIVYALLNSVYLLQSADYCWLCFPLFCWK